MTAPWKTEKINCDFSRVELWQPEGESLKISA